MGRFEHLISRQHLERPVVAASHHSEWQSAPLGRLGRELIADIERYLEFFEIACSELPPDRVRPAR